MRPRGTTVAADPRCRRSGYQRETQASTTPCRSRRLQPRASTDRSRRILPFATHDGRIQRIMPICHLRGHSGKAIGTSVHVTRAAVDARSPKATPGVVWEERLPVGRPRRARGPAAVPNPRARGRNPRPSRSQPAVGPRPKDRATAGSSPGMPGSPRRPADGWTPRRPGRSASAPRTARTPRPATRPVAPRRPG